MSFSDELKQKITSYLTRYETKRSAILPVLHAIQREFSYIDDEHVIALEKDYGLDRIQVREVITFYSAYITEKPKKYRILFCDSVSCHIEGTPKAMKKIEEHIADCENKGKESLFSLEGVPCLGVCGGAPAMFVNEERYLNVTDDNVLSILRKYDSEESL